MYCIPIRFNAWLFWPSMIAWWTCWYLFHHKKTNDDLTNCLIFLWSFDNHYLVNKHLMTNDTVRQLYDIDQGWSIQPPTVEYVAWYSFHKRNRLTTWLIHQLTINETTCRFIVDWIHFTWCATMIDHLIYVWLLNVTCIHLMAWWPTKFTTDDQWNA